MCNFIAGVIAGVVGVILLASWVAGRKNNAGKD